MSVFGRRNQRGRIRPLNGAVGGVYGSSVAGTFVRDAVNGTDSVDFVVIGDSNAMFTSVGWSGGIIRALHNRGATMYATAIYPGGNVLAATPAYPGGFLRKYVAASTGDPISPTGLGCGAADQNCRQSPAVR